MNIQIFKPYFYFAAAEAVAFASALITFHVVAEQLQNLSKPTPNQRSADNLNSFRLSDSALILNRIFKPNLYFAATEAVAFALALITFHVVLVAEQLQNQSKPTPSQKSADNQNGLLRPLRYSH